MDEVTVQTIKLLRQEAGVLNRIADGIERGAFTMLDSVIVLQGMVFVHDGLERMTIGLKDYDVEDES